MYFQSTRSGYKADSVDAVISGPAPDGGLYIDPKLGVRPFDWEGCLDLSPLNAMEKLLSFMLPDFHDMSTLAAKAYEGKFPLPDMTPLACVGEDYVLELFHGPTCAFKDVALSMLPRLMTAARRQKNIGDKILILTATSGDTGKAALEGFRDVEGTEIIVFYPLNGVSAIQKAQMTGQIGKNVHVCAVRGNFDDCQSAVKKVFSDINKKFLASKGVRLSSANSINIGRLAPQTAYYFTAYSALVKRGRIKLGDKVDFSVPTGNFGDILAGYFAGMLGLPVRKLICASNANNVLTDFISTGIYDRRRDLIKTSSPSMDILVSSNLERLLFFASGGDVVFVNKCMKGLSENGIYKIAGTVLKNIQNSFAAFYCGEDETKRTIAEIWRRHDYLCDTHTAAAFFAAANYKSRSGDAAPMVILSTASPYKFPAAVLAALGEKPDGDEFDMMQNLSQISGIPIPPPLVGLREKKALHKDVVEKDEILRYVLKIISECEDR